MSCDGPKAEVMVLKSGIWEFVGSLNCFDRLRGSPVLLLIMCPRQAGRHEGGHGWA